MRNSLAHRSRSLKQLSCTSKYDSERVPWSMDSNVGSSYATVHTLSSFYIGTNCTRKTVLVFVDVCSCLRGTGPFYVHDLAEGVC